MKERDSQKLTGRNRRLFFEWNRLDERISQREDIDYIITQRNALGIPNRYLVTYHIRSICGVTHVEELNQVGVSNRPLFASCFQMQIDIPEDYPCIDAMPSFCFLTKDAAGEDIPHPWHPNIRYFGEFAGRVCLNAPDSYMDLVWYVERIALYLKYELYHALQEPPYPEDMKVAQWVLKQGEPLEWIFFDQE
ncbi:MAG: ubiquitin-conjugating enzyme E2 [Parabacteroides sp.]|nr:ubiquitin-conjugating enzyme E2 [Parabacteroides sp.]